ncbi:tetratricopeptide repeat protein [Photorhabdus tasmaniensis]|uniref:tetratricopeptide repeat protein n=1 Tax=Photorhabdus tasmaniensis TaxID=1004159 RepID=UPI0040428746
MSSESQSLIEATLYYNRTNVRESIWSEATCLALTHHNFDMNGYVITQALEPSFLKEVSDTVNIPYTMVENFTYPCKGPGNALQWLLSMKLHLPDIQKLNLARALITTARYRLAQAILAEINSQKLHPEQKITYLITRFIVGNRLGIHANHTHLFENIRTIIETEKISEESILEATSLAIVWYLKTKAICPATYVWFETCGKCVAESILKSETFKAKLALSSFYRAYAMVPAAISDPSTTRILMLKAQHFAESLEPQNDLEAALAATAKKTVLESAVKEMLYVSQDFDAAEQYGLELVSLDPHWSTNYQELAEVYIKKNEYEKALEQYHNAKHVGLPRAILTEYMIGVCHAYLDNSVAAINAFKSVLRADVTNISAGLSGYKVASKNDLSSKEYFRDFLERWDGQGLLTKEHKEMMA